MANDQSALELPVIDLFDENSKAGTSAWLSKCKDVRDALEQYGCFLTPYNNVSPQLQDQLFNSLQQLFDLPAETKVQNTSDKPFFGYIAHPLFPLNESMGIEAPYLLDRVQSFTDLMWPAGGNKDFCESIHAYSKLVCQLEQIVKHMVFESYGVGKYYDSMVDSTTYLLRFNKYGTPKEDEARNCSVAHTDKSFLTILHCNQVEGLQMQTHDSRWIGVQPSGSMFLLMAGDAFSAWSNGRMHSAFHRVVSGGRKDRYSLAFFTYGKTVETPEEFIDEEHPLQFKPFDNIDLLGSFSLDDAIEHALKINGETKYAV